MNQWKTYFFVRYSYIEQIDLIQIFKQSDKTQSEQPLQVTEWMNPQPLRVSETLTIMIMCMVRYR